MTESPDIFRELAQFRSSKPRPEYRGKERNIFWSVSEEDIAYAENKMGFPLPEILKRFYREVGWGKICSNRQQTQVTYDPNRIEHPSRIVEIYLRQAPDKVLWEEWLDPKDLVFFDRGDSYFFVFRPFGEDPAAIFDPNRDAPVAPDFVTFLEPLYGDIEFWRSEEDDDDED